MFKFYELEERFRAALEVIKNIPQDGTFEPSEEMMLKLYAFEKQATEGPCSTLKPYLWNISSRAKWQAWKTLGNMSRNEAMVNYIKELTKVIETMSYNETISRFMSLMGPFYEEITAEDTEIEKFSPYPLPLYENYFPSTVLEQCNVPKDLEPEKQLPKQMVKVSKHFSCAGNEHDSYSSSTSESSEFDLLSDLTEADSSDCEKRLPSCSIDKHKQVSLSKNDVLVLSFINLQTSMEEVLKKFNNLHSLASSVEASRDSEKWYMNLTATAFAFLWPVACTAMLEDFHEFL